MRVFCAGCFCYAVDIVKVIKSIHGNILDQVELCSAYVVMTECKGVDSSLSVSLVLNKISLNDVSWISSCQNPNVGIGQRNVATLSRSRTITSVSWHQ